MGAEKGERTMKKTILVAGLLICAAGAGLADPVEGIWRTADGEDGGYLHVSIAPCGSSLCGTISKAFDASAASSNDYEHLGKPIIRSMNPEGNGAYGGGTIWAPDTDKTYKSKMQLSGDTLEVKGCVAGGLVCRGQNWTRVN